MATIKILDKDKCTGCGSCYNVCPVNAISMENSSEGFLYPEINEKCIDCGKCVKACPVLTPIKSNNTDHECYAVMASEDIRLKSSSGGVFALLSEYVFERNGYVCGAAWTSDHKVEHIIINNRENLGKLQTSKYVQSDTNKVFLQIKKLLKNGQYVLFTGCPCQVAGIKAYLGKDYEHLITADIICHGVPSPKALDKYLQQRANGKKIKNIEFRNKKIFKWEHSTTIDFADGTSYIKPRAYCSWYKSFLNILNCRKSCGKCLFATIPRVGDLTIGDFWGVGEFYPQMDDRKGTSVVLINNSTGKTVFEHIKSHFARYCEANLEHAKKYNWNIVGSSKAHVHRDRFFKLLDLYDYDKAVDYGINRKFDIGYVGWWYGKNYGSVMTNFALHQYLTSLGYSILMLEWPLREKPTLDIEDNFNRRFTKKYYEISRRYTYDTLSVLNHHCDTFMVGSDQLWNYYSTKENDLYFFLDFVNDTKKKISYATSFGHPTYFAPREMVPLAGFHLHRFDAVSVREKDGIKVCKDFFDVEAEQTLEPVFLCDPQNYDDVIAESKMDEKADYLLAYILSPTPAKREAIYHAANKLNLRPILILDGQENFENNKRIMNMESELRSNLEMEDWLYYFKNSKYVITDSFHGVCFSIIFKKTFICIANYARGISRFETLLSCLYLNERMVLNENEIINGFNLKKSIDYTTVDRALAKEVKRSKRWLVDALNKPKKKILSNYDMMIIKEENTKKQLLDLKKQLNELKNKI